MKIPPAQTESFLRSPDKAVQAVLVYGPDSGLVSERAKALSLGVVSDINDPFNVVDIPFSRIKEDPVFLADEVASISLMGGRRLIKVSDTPATLGNLVADILKAPPGDAFMVFAAGDLPPASSARQLFEKQPNLAAIACYNDDSVGVGRIVQSTLKEAGYTYDSQVVSFLQQSFQGDRLIILNELRKLLLYMGDITHITLDDAEKCIGSSAEVTLDELCAAVASGNASKAEIVLERIMQDGIPAVAVLRALLRYFSRLHYAKSLVRQGMTEQQAMGNLRPPVFFKQVPQFSDQLRRLSELKLMKTLQALTKAELECKKTGNPVDIICRQLLAMLAMSNA